MTICCLCDGAGIVKSYPRGCLRILCVDCAACDGTGQSEPRPVPPGPSSAELIAALTETYLAENAKLLRRHRESVVA